MSDLHIVREGKPGAKKILLIHGNLASTRWWSSTISAMQSEFDLVALDMRGYGKSPAESETVTLANHAAEIQAVVEELQFAPCTLVGHSLGGAVAMQFAALYPEQMNGLVLVDAAPVSGMKEINYDVVQMMLDNQDILLPALQSTFVKPVPDAVWQEFAEDCLIGAKSFLANTRALDGADFTAAAKIFPKPVLVIHGELDRVVSVAEANNTAQAYPQANLAIVAGVGHNPQIEASEPFATLLGDFVRAL